MKPFELFDYERGHRVLQRTCWVAIGFMLAYLVWGPK